MPRPRVQIDAVVGLTLQVGVLVSLALVAVGLVWHRATWHTWQLDYTLPATSVAGFLAADVRQASASAARPRLLVNLGIGTLLLTPYVRVLASMVWFLVVERNLKYGLVTAIVLALLTYSLIAG